VIVTQVPICLKPGKIEGKLREQENNGRDDRFQGASLQELLEQLGFVFLESPHNIYSLL
jgi:hypothetical protein